MKKGLLSCICAITCLMAMAQWNANPSESMLAWPDGKSYYANEMQIGEDGTTWLCVYHPQNGTVATTIQAIDSTGVKLLGEEGLLVSEERNMTYTVVNQLVMVDKDWNFYQFSIVPTLFTQSKTVVVPRIVPCWQQVLIRHLVRFLSL